MRSFSGVVAVALIVNMCSGLVNLTFNGAEEDEAPGTISSILPFSKPA
jgi:hypothetical protein